MDECLYGKGGPGSRYTRGQRLKDEEAFHYLVKEDFINGVVGGAWHEEGYYISNRGYLADMIYWKLRVLNREWECGNEIR